MKILAIKNLQRKELANLKKRKLLTEEKRLAFLRPSFHSNEYQEVMKKCL